MPRGDGKKVDRVPGPPRKRRPRGELAQLPSRQLAARQKAYNDENLDGPKFHSGEYQFPGSQNPRK